MTRFRAVLDACVLVPASQTDTLLRLGAAGLYHPLWSSLILREVDMALERVHPLLAAERRSRRFQSMNQAFPNASVSGWERLLPDLTLPDEGDLHVLAAAIAAGADVIVTSNVRDFPAQALQHHDISVLTPDAFLVSQLEQEPARVIDVLNRQAAETNAPPLSVEEILDRLELCGNRRFAELARERLSRSGHSVPRPESRL